MNGSELERYLNKVTCGDYRDLIPQLPDRSIDLVVTDPPYDLDLARAGGGIAARPNVQIYEKLKNGFGTGFDPTHLLNLLKDKMKKFNGYFWCSVRQLRRYIEFAESNQFLYDVLVWCKRNPIPTNKNNYLSDLEYCVFIRERGAKFNNRLQFDLYRKWWLSSRVNKIDHPTPKLPGLMRNHILISSSPGDIVLDPFVGSGTTAVQCKRLGRKFVAFDINQNYVDMTNEELRQETLKF